MATHVSLVLSEVRAAEQRKIGERWGLLLHIAVSPLLVATAEGLYTLYIKTLNLCTRAVREIYRIHNKPSTHNEQTGNARPTTKGQIVKMALSGTLSKRLTTDGLFSLPPARFSSTIPSPPPLTRPPCTDVQPLFLGSIGAPLLLKIPSLSTL